MIRRVIDITKPTDTSASPSLEVEMYPLHLAFKMEPPILLPKKGRVEYAELRSTIRLFTIPLVAGAVRWSLTSYPTKLRTMWSNTVLE